MNANNAIGKTFIDIESIFDEKEKLELAEAWQKGIPKTWSGANLFLKHNLVECIQPRRLSPKTGYRKTRHMLVTRNFWLAKKLARLRGVKMHVANERSKSWYRERKLLLVWDIVYNDWRMINLKTATKWRILDFIPFETDEQFRKVGNIWVTHMKKIQPGGTGSRTYCNYLRKGI